MTPSSCILMAEYNRWMNTRLYDAAARLTEPQLFEDRGAFFGSLFDTLNHVAVADTIWLHRFACLPDLSWMKNRMDAFAWPASLTQRVAQSLDQLREYREKADTVITELTTLLCQAGVDVGVTDLAAILPHTPDARTDVP